MSPAGPRAGGGAVGEDSCGVTGPCLVQRQGPRWASLPSRGRGLCGRRRGAAVPSAAE